MIFGIATLDDKREFAGMVIVEIEVPKGLQLLNYVAIVPENFEEQARPMVGKFITGDAVRELNKLVAASQDVYDETCHSPGASIGVGGLDGESN